MTRPHTDSASGWVGVVTAAGQGTRFRPFSAAVPKEMLPLGGKPAVEHVIDECLDAGASQVIVVTRPSDPTVPAYAEELRRQGLPIEDVAEDTGHGYGNAAPLLTLRERLGDAAVFGVAFGDDLLLAPDASGHDLAAMREAARSGADAVIAAQPINRDRVSAFGVVDVATGNPDQVVGIRQRPDPATVTEPLALVSRLMLRPSILDRLVPSPTAGGEIDLGTAVGELAAFADVRVHRLSAEWVTVGDPVSYFQALSRYWHTAADGLPQPGPDQGHEPEGAPC